MIAYPHTVPVSSPNPTRVPRVWNIETGSIHPISQNTRLTARSHIPVQNPRPLHLIIPHDSHRGRERRQPTPVLTHIHKEPARPRNLLEVPLRPGDPPHVAPPEHGAEELNEGHLRRVAAQARVRAEAVEDVGRAVAAGVDRLGRGVDGGVESGGDLRVLLADVFFESITRGQR